MSLSQNVVSKQVRKRKDYNIKNIYPTLEVNQKVNMLKDFVDVLSSNKDMISVLIKQLVETNGIDLINSTIQEYVSKEIIPLEKNKYINIGLDKDEPILNPDNKKFTAFPIKYQNIWNRYKEQMACFWKPEEIDFSNDYEDFLSLNKDEQFFIEMILAFFAASDGIVNFNLSERFVKEVQNTEILFAYRFQAMMEDIHSHTYSLMLDNIVRDQKRKEYLFNAINTVESVKLMADWAFKWIESSKSFAHRIVAFAIVEGVFFSGAFASIFWIKKYKNKAKNNTKSKPFMDGLIKSNKFIARDEGLHANCACDIYSLLNNKLPASEINEIMKDGVNIAKKFMTDALPVKLIGMNSESMCNYIEYIGDRLLVLLGNKKIYNKSNPFKFMESIGLNDKTNFFETRPHEYQDSNIMNKTKKSEISITDDF